MSQERWEAFLHQRDNCTVFDTPFANVDFGIVLPTGDEQGVYRPTIHEHRAFENTLAPSAKFHIANVRRGIMWNKTRPSQRVGDDPLLQYEVSGGRRFRCPLCHKEMQRNLRIICHHVEGTKHLNIRFLYYNHDYSTPKPEPTTLYILDV
ncbi:hypothetical protein PENSPDRAFT_656525 [Peniophora sp. CONT]|nr:hypothetical protein PENSPDRAFT_656525 [Peniophora sp. CONT]